MVKKRENNGTEKLRLVTPTPKVAGYGTVYAIKTKYNKAHYTHILPHTRLAGRLVWICGLYFDDAIF